MRKFFKGLAVLLALTLIVGVIPAAAADSLSMAKEKVLYLDGSKGQKEDGTQCKTSYKKLVANMIKGFDKDTMSVVLSSADKSIVSTTKAGRIVAKSLGTTTVTVTVYDASETEIFKQDLKVKVKKNAADVTVTGIADGDKFSVGQTVDVTLPRAGVDTDERELTVDKTDIAEIKLGEKARTYTVKFLKAGEATFTAKAYQSAKYPAPTQTKTIKVTVTNPAPTGAKIVASNAYELTFAEDVEAYGLFKNQNEIANDACYYMLNDTKVTFSAVKEVKAKANTVKVTMYDNFAAGTTYYVVVNECEPISLVIAGNAAKDVESIAIVTDTVTANTPAPVTVLLYNKDGVDITNSVGTGSVSIESSNPNSYVENLTLNMYNVDEETTVTATFVYYDANNNYEEVKKTASKKIKAVPEASEVFSGLVYSVDGTGNVASENYSNPKNYVSLSDTTFEFKAWVKITKGNQKYGIAVNGINTFNGHALYAKIPEESVALLSSMGNDTDADTIPDDGLYAIQPNQVGRTNVFIGYDDNGFKTVAVAPIEVKEKRYPATLTVKASKSNLNLTDLDNDGLKTNDDSLTLEAEVKDQFNDYIAATLKTEQNKESGKVVPVNAALLTDASWSANGGTGKYKLVVKASDVTYPNTNSQKGGNVVLTTKITETTSKASPVGTNFSVKDNIERKDASDALTFANSGSASLDTTITGTTNIKKASIKAQLSSNGYFTGDITPTLVATAPTTSNVGTSAAVTYSFQLVIKKDSTIITPANLADPTHELYDFLKTTDGGVTYDLYSINADNAVLKKLPKGNYSFTIYKIKTHDAVSKNVISSKTLVVNVTDNQANPTFTQKSETASLSLASGNDFSECFKFYFAGKEYDGVTGVYDSKSSSANTNAYFVSGCKLTVTVGVKGADGSDLGNKNFPLDCAINKLIKVDTTK